MAKNNKELIIKINNITDNADGSSYDYIDTNKYSFASIMSWVKNKSKFSELIEIGQKITDIVKSELFGLISHRFMIYAYDRQDAYIAATYLARLLIKCSALFSVEDNDDGRYIVNHKQFSFGFGAPMTDFENSNSGKSETTRRLLDQFKNGENFVYDEVNAYDGEISQLSLNNVDCDKEYSIIFDIVMCNSQPGWCDKDINSPIISEKPSEKWEICKSNFRKSTRELNVIPILIDKDSPDELEEIMKELIASSGFFVEDEKILGDIISEYDITNERNIRKTLKRILTNHILSDLNSNIISYDEVMNAAKIVNTKIAAVNHESFSKPDKLIGLDNVLSKVDGIVDMIALAKEREENNLVSGMQGCNVTFVGSPGTGKTSVAHYFAKKLYDRDIITSEHNFVECRKSDLVGLYVGWTASKIDNLFSSLHERGGGVLFIDEAYSLAENEQTCYDTEAVNALVLNMETYRQSVFCIFAGYEDKMDRFLSSNNGLRSRIQFNVKFNDYNNSDLFDIFNCIVTSNDFTIPKNSRNIVEEYFSRLKVVRGGQFGNGREARNLFSNAMQKLSARIAKKKKHNRKDISTITIEDLKLAVSDIIGSETANIDNIKVGFKL